MLETGILDKIMKSNTTRAPRRSSFRTTWIIILVSAGLISFSSMALTKTPPRINPELPKEHFKILQQIRQNTAVVDNNIQSSKESKDQKIAKDEREIYKIVNPASLSKDPLYGNRDFHLVVVTRARAALLNQTLIKIFEHINPNEVDVTVYEHLYDKKTVEVIDSFPRAYRVNTMESYLSQLYPAIFKDILTRANGFKYLIVMEDDLSPSNDFFQYFKHFAPLLNKEPSLFTISAWSDSSFPYFVRDETAVHRRNIFVGLGWMTKRTTIEKIVKEWKVPRTAWDVSLEQWAFENNLSYNLFPEVPRVHHTFIPGMISLTTNWISQAVFYENMALASSLNTKFGDLNTYTKEGYEALVKHWFESAIPITDFNDALWVHQDQILVLYYNAAPGEDLGNLYDLFGVLYHASHTKSRQRDFCDGLTRYWVNSNYILLVEEGTTFGDMLLKTKPNVKPINPSSISPLELGKNDVTIHIGAINESCTDVCRKHVLECDVSKFHVVDSCDVLKKYFSCKQEQCPHTGFKLEGILPEYFEFPGQNSEECFTTTLRYVNCDTRTQKTRRICPCVLEETNI